MEETVDSQSEEVIEESKEDLNQVETFLLQYSESMKPRVPVGEDKGTMLQYQLWKTLENIINTENVEEFKNNFKTVMKYFNTDPAFGPVHVYRFSEYWRWSTDELNTFQKLINILLLTSNPSERQDKLKEIDLNKALEEGFTDQAKQNITTFLLG